MEKYSKYKKHQVDTYAKLIAAALEAKGIYEPKQHDAIIMAVAPLFVRLEQARKYIDKEGLIIKEKSREGDERFKRNPACDIELAVMDRIRKMCNDMGIMKAKAFDDEDDITEKEQDPLKELNKIMAGIGQHTYRKPLS